MSSIVRRIVLSTAVIALLATANLAQANQIRSSAERHQRPGLGFFVKHTSGTPFWRR